MRFRPYVSGNRKRSSSNTRFDSSRGRYFAARIWSSSLRPGTAVGPPTSCKVSTISLRVRFGRLRFTRTGDAGFVLAKAAGLVFPVRPRPGASALARVAALAPCFPAAAFFFAGIADLRREDAAAAFRAEPAFLAAVFLLLAIGRQYTPDFGQGTACSGPLRAWRGPSYCGGRRARGPAL